jgi:hypothetical protein
MPSGLDSLGLPAFRGDHAAAPADTSSAGPMPAEHMISPDKGAPLDQDRKSIAERVGEAVRQFGPTAVAIARMLLDLLWRDGRGPSL